MFDKLRSAYHLLIALAVLQIGLAIQLGSADLATTFDTRGMAPMILTIGGLFPLVWIAGVAIRITRRRTGRPSLVIWRMIRRERAWLLRGAVLAVLVLAFARAFSSFKSTIPDLNPFWADPLLTELDYLTFGVDPWRITHALIGPWGTVVLDRIYFLWFLMMFLTLSWFCFTRDAALQLRGLLCFLLSWSVLGGAAAVGLSSVGPCFYQQFYGSDRFVPLMSTLHAMHAETPLTAVGAMDYLIASLGKDRFGAGISAMPSLHVTIAMLSSLAVYEYSRSRALKTLSGLFTLAISIGSVHLGWHYAWDGIFGIIAVTLFWWGSGRLVVWLAAREQRQGPAAAPARSARALPATP